MNLPGHIHPRYEEVNVGMRVKFRCQVQKMKQTPKYDVSWIFSNDPIYGKISGRHKENLLIPNAALHNNGFYTCTSHKKGVDGYGYDFIATAELRVFGKSM